LQFDRRRSFEGYDGRLPSRLAYREHIERGVFIPLLVDTPSDRFDTYLVWPVAQFYPMKLRVAVEKLAHGSNGIGEF
jgi:hypothetical protein